MVFDFKDPLVILQTGQILVLFLDWSFLDWQYTSPGSFGRSIRKST